MKCSICKSKIQTTFLNKIKGTYVKKNGKKYVVCNICQKKYKNLIDKIK